MLLAGKRVASAFGLDEEYLADPVAFPIGGRPVAVHVVPHPSGVNRWWNEPANRERARAFLAEDLGRPW